MFFGPLSYATHAEQFSSRFGMLGLGDIAVPGLFTSFLAKWDAAPWLTQAGFVWR